MRLPASIRARNRTARKRALSEQRECERYRKGSVSRGKACMAKSRSCGLVIAMVSFANLAAEHAILHRVVNEDDR